MFFSVKSQTNSTSKDAMTVAPCSCTAENRTNSEYFSGIALAMSVLLYIVISVVIATNIILSITILSILLIMCNKFCKEKAVSDRV